MREGLGIGLVQDLVNHMSSGRDRVRVRVRDRDRDRVRVRVRVRVRDMVRYVREGLDI